MDRFDFKLVGKKEMFVPYNAYAAVYQRQAGRPAQAEPPEPRPRALGAAPRVGRRSDAEARASATSTASAPSTSTRTRWAALASDEYDARGQLYRAGFAYMAPSYDVPAPYTDMFATTTWSRACYSLTGFIAETGGLQPHQAAAPSASGRADALAGAGVR